MPDPSHRPYTPMTIIRPHSMPRFWWLCPWAYARELHRASNALRALCDKQDDTIAKQSRIIIDQHHDIVTLKARVRTQDAIIHGLPHLT